MEKKCRTCGRVNSPNMSICNMCGEEHPAYSMWIPQEKEERKPDFIKKYNLNTPQIIHQIDDSGTDKYIASIVEKIHATSVERHDKVLIDSIVAIAREAGVTDLYILNKEAIVEALRKQIPVKCTDEICPECNRGVAIFSADYCPHCGQKLKWWKNE